jgi:regulator of sigma E protease
MRFTVLRDGKEMELYVKSDLDKSTGAGRIGVYFWADPIVDSVAKDSAAEKAGIKPGDIIAKVNGEDLKYSIALLKWLEPAAQAATHEASGDASSAESAPLDLNLEINRGGNLINTVLAIPRGGEDPIGIAWKAVEYHTPHYSIPGAAAKGFSETWETLVVSVRSLGLLFRGIDLTKAVSGPVRITYMAGDIATYGFSQSFATGLRGVGNFLALISIALAVMNLLPLPVLDGGLIVIFLVELIRRKPLNPSFISAIQTAGVVLIAGLMIIAVFGDILFLAKR